MAYNLPTNLSPQITIGGLSPLRILSTTTGINGLTTGLTALYTGASGKSTICIGAIMRLTNANGIASPAIVGISDSTSSRQIISGVTVTGLDALSECYYLQPSLSTSAVNTLFIVPSGNTISFNVISAFTATSVTFAVDLIGYDF